MSDTAAPDTAAPDPADQVTLRIAAPPSAVWAVISDPAGLGSLSPECIGGEWLDGAGGPAVGARFKGRNRRGWVRWSTTNTVVEAETDRAFAFDTRDSGTRWRFELVPDGEGTLVTESRSPTGPYPLLARLFTSTLLGGVDGHTAELRAGMQATLERLRDRLEQPS